MTSPPITETNGESRGTGRHPGTVLAIGNFDGVHRGHQSVIAAARGAAGPLGGTVGALTFAPHPRQFFQPDAPHFPLTPEPLKGRLLTAAGCDFYRILTFDAAFASLSAEAFARDVLVRDLGAQHVVVGHDFHFGKGRAGNPERLVGFGAQHGFGVTVVEAVGDDEGAYASRAIRAALSDGSPDEAADMLGHWWRVSGEVVSGAGRGHGLGFPTANVAMTPGQTLAHGIYAVFVFAHGQRYRGAAYLGTRPTFDNGKPLLETFLLDFSGNLYGEVIDIAFVQHLRGDKAFESGEALSAQMAIDVANANTALDHAEMTPPDLPLEAVLSPGYDR